MVNPTPVAFLIMASSYNNVSSLNLEAFAPEINAPLQSHFSPPRTSDTLSKQDGTVLSVSIYSAEKICSVLNERAFWGALRADLYPANRKLPTCIPTHTFICLHFRVRLFSNSATHIKMPNWQPIRKQIGKDGLEKRPPVMICKSHLKGISSPSSGIG
jgi:hypothetical protein